MILAFFSHDKTEIEKMTFLWSQISSGKAFSQHILEALDNLNRKNLSMCERDTQGVSK